MASSVDLYLKLTVLLYLFIVYTDAQASFYDKGSIKLDRKVHKKMRIDLPSGKAFPFYGSRYSSIWLTTGGFLSFDERAEYGNVDFSSTSVKPSLDYPIIAPFFHSGEGLDTQHGNGQIYYRTLNTTHNQQELNNFGTSISNAVVGIKNFQPTGGLIVTWVNVSDALEMALGCASQNTCKTSTFQAAIVTDEYSLAFAIFNYANMDITVNDQRPYYQCGFNAGYGRGWTTAIPKNEIKYANIRKGSDVTGRYYFQISSERMLRGGCRDRRLQAGSMALEMSPRVGGMYGGQMIEISGPCLSPSDRITCKFGNTMSNSTSALYINEMKARCYIPRLLERGRIGVTMQTQGISSYSGVMTIVIPAMMGIDLHSIEQPGSGWSKIAPQTLSLSWDSRQLSNQSNAQVVINLIGYQEESNTAEWTVLKTLGSGPNVLNTGSYTFNTRDYRCSTNCDVETGIVEVRLKDMRTAASHYFLVTKELPLGWFVNNAMVQRYGSQWSHEKCLAWYNTDRLDMTWRNDLPYCPCNLRQALVDIGKFQTDPGCDMFKGSVCTYHKGAGHCVRSSYPGSSGAGNQCCYNKTDGNLMYAADSFQGSTPDRSHAWGAYPFERPGLVPSMSHWVKDVVTFYYCCIWQNYNSDCNYYMDQRATRDCKFYNPPKAAAIYGLSHVRTFDNSHFIVTGEGDFTLLTSNDVTIQGRFSSKPYNTSVVLTNIGIQSGQEMAEIRLGPATYKRGLDVLVNNTYQFFDDVALYVQDYSEMKIINNPSRSASPKSNFTVVLRNGIGVQVASTNGILGVIVMVPYALKGQVNGLLGTWNDNKMDDLMPRYQNQAAVISTDLRTVYTQFVYTWRVNSLDESILPHVIIPTNTSVASGSPSPGMPSQCRQDRDCAYDYQYLYQRAIDTRDASIRFQQIQSFSVLERSCGLLNVPRSVKDNHDSSLGSTVSVVGCKSGTLTGDTYTYTCTSTSNTTQEWSPSVSASCTAAPLDEADVGMIAGIVVAIVVVLIIAIIVAIVLRRKSKKGKRNSETDGGKYSADSPNPVTSGEYDARYSQVREAEDLERGDRGRGKEFTV